MMQIAKVIIDVKARAINRPFDYLIPEEMQTVVKRGVRVAVPFGPRQVIGFVVGVEESSSIDRLKSIIETVDLTPILTNELIDLGKWMAKETMCFYITALQAMLPQLLKTTFERDIIKLTNRVNIESIDQLFQQTDVIPYDVFLTSKVSYAQLKQAIDQKEIYIRYTMKSRETKRYETIIYPCGDEHSLKEFLEELSPQATRQKELVEYFINHPNKVPQRKLIKELQTTRQHIKTLIDKEVLAELKEEIYRNPYENREFQDVQHLHLTDEQETALKSIEKNIDDEEHDVFLLHGVTGSGKTEVYLRAIQRVLEEGKEAIVLVPEISLTPQMVARFKGRFGDNVAVLHSGLSQGEKYDEWRKVQRNEVQVVVGARSAIFAPFENIGIIIIDEEHEGTYKQEDQPRYHARDVAIYRGKTYHCPVVLGSATPTLESYARADKSVYHLETLKTRTNNQQLPYVQTVDMRKELHAGNRTMFSRELMEQMKERIAKNEQIVLLLNRRGYSTFVMCRDCGFVTECPNCDIALTYHKITKQLKCHYCSYEQQFPDNCPSCQSDLIRYFGTGTQRVEESLRELLPEASIIRMDNDTTRRKGAHERLLADFSDQKANILLGTQMIAKGLDFPNVTLVGVLTADSMLNLPDFRAAEKTFQLITQVSGRAGRHELPGEVIVQTYTPDHYSIELASTYNYEEFYKKEMSIRRTFQYPPYVFLGLVTVSHEDESYAIQVTQRIVQTLIKYIGDQTVILGPTPSPIARIKNRYRYQCMIKYKEGRHIRQVLNGILKHYMTDMHKNDLKIQIDMQPYQLM